MLFTATRMKGKVGVIETKRAFVEVVVPLLGVLFTYEVPSSLQEKVKSKEVRS